MTQETTFGAFLSPSAKARNSTSLSKLTMFCLLKGLYTMQTFTWFIIAHW